MFRYIVIFILSIQAVTAQSDGCYHENFDSAEQSAFSSACRMYSYPIWEFKTYGDETLTAPSTSVSNGYIKTQSSSSACIAKNLSLNVNQGSQIRVTYFATGSETHLILQLNHFLGVPADTFRVTPELNTWTTATFTSSTSGSYSFHIIAYTTTGSVAIDSVTYVDNADDYEVCAFPEGGISNPEQPEVPEENPNVPDNPEVPENPGQPENPEIPPYPEVPENPEQPENPGVPETPEVPEIPEQPESSEVPENPENPEVPTYPEVPENPVQPENPEQPESPEVPENPENPEVPAYPEVPENPEQPENPEEPENPVEPGQPENSAEEPENPGQPGEPNNSGETIKTKIISQFLVILLFPLVSYSFIF